MTSMNGILLFATESFLYQREKLLKLKPFFEAFTSEDAEKILQEKGNLYFAINYHQLYAAASEANSTFDTMYSAHTLFKQENYPEKENEVYRELAEEYLNDIDFITYVEDILGESRLDTMYKRILKEESVEDIAIADII